MHVHLNGGIKLDGLDGDINWMEIYTGWGYILGGDIYWMGIYIGWGYILPIPLGRPLVGHQAAEELACLTFTYIYYAEVLYYCLLPVSIILGVLFP